MTDRPARDIYQRLPDGPLTDYADGELRWAPVKSLWFTANLLVALIAAPMTASLGAVAVWLGLSVLTLCGGHSLGMHRKLIHDSYACPFWLECWGVHLACLVGLGGPRTMMAAHDIRDMAQRQDDCHPFYSQHDHILRDLWRQMHCQFHPRTTPVLHLPDTLGRPAMVWLQRTSMLQNVVLGGLLWWIGDLGWAVWGVCVRVSVSMMGHALVGWFAHNRGPQDWYRPEAGVQGHNVRFMSLISFGESFHNNHHAFPESANFGLMPGQWDAGYVVLKTLERIGLVWDIKEPDTEGGAVLGAGECAPVRLSPTPPAKRATSRPGRA